MAQHKRATGREGRPRHRILDRLNDIAIKVYGPGDRLG